MPSLCWCTRCHSPARKPERLVGVTSHRALPPLLPPSRRAGVLGASCTTAADAAAVGSSDTCRARDSRWDRIPTLLSSAAAAAPGWSCAAPEPAPLLARPAAVSDSVSTANKRCHSLSPISSRLTGRGLSGCSSASAAAAAASKGASGDAGLANCTQQQAKKSSNQTVRREQALTFNVSAGCHQHNAAVSSTRALLPALVCLSTVPEGITSNPHLVPDVARAAACPACTGVLVLVPALLPAAARRIQHCAAAAGNRPASCRRRSCRGLCRSCAACGVSTCGMLARRAI